MCGETATFHLNLFIYLGYFLNEKKRKRKNIWIRKCNLFLEKEEKTLNIIKTYLRVYHLYSVFNYKLPAPFIILEN